MLVGFSIDDISNTIKNEDELINIFDYLIKDGLDPFQAYNFISEKYGDDEISKFLDDEIFKFLDDESTLNL